VETLLRLFQNLFIRKLYMQVSCKECPFFEHISGDNF
jgi:hypothetical protein